MSWYTELQEKAAENIKAQGTAAENINDTRGMQQAKKHKQEIDSIMLDVGVGLYRRKQRELEQRQEEERKAAAERLRQEDIKTNGSSDYNNKEHRESLRRLANSCFKTSDRTSKILN